jgi:hypothetical protein
MALSDSEKQDELFKKLHTLQKEVSSMNVGETQRLASITTALVVSKTTQILQSLRYESMSQRHSRIVKAHKQTFDWVFNPENLPPSDVRSKIEFKKWLLSRGGIFWISGKPGSGKSTLMKYLSDDLRTTTFLQKWAGESKLSIASFYFWNAGTDMQKSQQGLLQSVLFEILGQCPELIPEVCRARWEATEFQRFGPWGPAELARAFELLQGRASTSSKFCFFIDGLDEYEGDHFELLDTMINLVKSPYIKLCLSSRPWNCFEDALGNDFDRKLYMQDLTREDIEIYAGDKLKLPLRQVWTYENRVQHQTLVQDIVERAQGVFLWVYLVVRSLQEGLANGDDVSMLHTRLRTLPTDLEPYFEYILKSVDGIYREKLACMLQVALLAQEPLNLMLYSFLDEDDPDFAIKLPPTPFDITIMDSRQKAMQRRITGRTKGLLEVAGKVSNSSSHLYFKYRVEFLHRTVRDFLNTEYMQLYLSSITPGTYNTSFALSRGFLACLKTVPSDQKANLSRTTATTSKDITYYKDEAWGFARNADESRGISDIPMLGELEKTGKSRFQLFFGRSTYFLECAIKNGLVNFVRDTLSQHPQVSLDGGPLLDVALNMSDCVMSNSMEARPNLIPMVQILLQAGVDPNATFCGYTVWKRSFEKYLPSTCHETWRYIIKYLLHWGVDIQEVYDSLELIAVKKLRVDAPISTDAVHILELLLSHGLDPNRPLSHGRTIWTRFLESICPKAKDLDPIIPVGFTKAFLLYGADPLATYHDQRGSHINVRPVSEAVTKYIVPLAARDGSSLANLLAKQVADFKNREKFSKKRNRSQSREPRKRQDIRAYR